MGPCLFCGETVGFGMICDDCKEAFLHQKKVYFTTKKLTETTELDEQMFELLYKNTGFDDFVDDVFFKESDIPEIIRAYREILFKEPSVEWLRQKEGRFDNFMKYAEERLKKTAKEQVK